MGTIKGTDGAVNKSGTAIAHIDSWELTASADNDETTAYGSRDKTYIQTTVGWSGTISGSYDSTDASQQALVDMFSSTSTGGPAAVTLTLVGSTADSDIYHGSFIVNSIANTGSIGTKRSFSAEVMASGGVARTTT